MALAKIADWGGLARLGLARDPKPMGSLTAAYNLQNHESKQVLSLEANTSGKIQVLNSCPLERNCYSVDTV